MCESENTRAFIYAKERPLHDNVPNTLIDLNENVKYKKVGFFGKGGYASCYEFQNTSTKVKYAIKVISKRRGTNPNDTRHRYKALDEAAIHANLEHENVVRLYGSFEDEFNVYLILEPCRHGTLSDVLMNRFRISPIEARYYLHQIASGCTYLHRHLVVHRDLKVNNILIDERVTAKICDFGFAVKLSDVNAKSNIICGTYDYLAPEVVDRHGHGFEVDAWAIGCIAYHLLVGQVPFKTASKEETFGLIKTAKYNPIPDHFRLPQSALNLISGTLQLNPEKRLTVSQILKHEFLVQPPEIPRYLPVSLLSCLNKNGENVTMEEYVTRVITLYQGIKSSGSYRSFFYRFICGSTCWRP